MNRMKTHRPLNSLAACLITMAVLHALVPLVGGAAWGWPWGDEPCGATCPACQYVCKFSAKNVDEKRHRYVADSEVVCIPRVVFPWQTDDCHRCVNNGARLRRINVLKREYYTCPHCDFRWSAEKRGDANEERDAQKKSAGEVLSPAVAKVSSSADRPYPIR